ncbi:hypothetical protein T492DRAFT_503703 [Pavlovales sp. CCMP2436]|nr:hypothetical protein T492DRAFT_503703 [Pavlovales sp. CCMP2436]
MNLPPLAPLSSPPFPSVVWESNTWALGQRLGQGKFAVVHEATCREVPGRRLAAKIVNSEIIRQDCQPVSCLCSPICPSLASALPSAPLLPLPLPLPVSCFCSPLCPSLASAIPSARLLPLPSPLPLSLPDSRHAHSPPLPLINKWAQAQLKTELEV